MKLLNYINENQNEMDGTEMEGAPNNYGEMLTKNTKTNENLTSEDLALHGITKENYINEKNTDNNFEEENSKSVNISKIIEVSQENSAHKQSHKKVNDNNKGSTKVQKGNSDRNNKSNSQSKIQ